LLEQEIKADPGANRCSSKSEPCLFITRDGGEAYLVDHVDDGVMVGPLKSFLISLANKFNGIFTLKQGDPAVFIGLELKREPDGRITILQSQYIQTLIQRFNLLDYRPARVPMQPGTDHVLFEKETAALPYR